MITQWLWLLKTNKVQTGRGKELSILLPHIRDSKTVLDSGFLGDGSGFFVSAT